MWLAGWRRKRGWECVLEQWWRRAAVAGWGDLCTPLVWLAGDVFGAPLPPAAPQQQLARHAAQVAGWLAATAWRIWNQLSPPQPVHRLRVDLFGCRRRQNGWVFCVLPSSRTRRILWQIWLFSLPGGVYYPLRGRRMGMVTRVLIEGDEAN